MTSVPVAREDILSLRSYQAGDQVDDTIRLNANEAPQSLWTETTASGLNRYPEVHPLTLRARMAELFDVSANNLLVTRGSSEAIDVLIRAWCRAYRDSLITTPPTFEMYRVYANIQGVQMIDVPLNADDNFALNTDAIIDNCTPSTKLIFICSPNNPTGTLVPVNDILKIVENRQQKSLVVVDEAYIEFANRKSMASLVSDYSNLVVLRTLSKAHALAGARCGAAIACQEIVDVMSKVLPPYSFPTPVIDSVMNALAGERPGKSAESVAGIIGERERVQVSLASISHIQKVWPSQSNFLLVRFGNLAAIQAHLFEHRILIRDFGSVAGLENCARITIGTHADNDALLNALASFGEASHG
jgi:histidinol-phosphate aminotransferase